MNALQNKLLIFKVFLQFQQSKENHHHFLKEHFVQIFKHLTKYQLKKQYDFL